MYYNNYNNNHQLIQRAQNYVLDRRLLTVHSCDRDVCKWPNANHFEIVLPEAYKNVQSLRLVEICFPVNYYNFSNELQNTCFDLSYSPAGITKDLSVCIQDGFYTPTELSIELKNKLNNIDPCFNVFWDSVGQKIYFGHSDLSFDLLFGNKIQYDLSCGVEEVFNRYTQWGLPAYLGYEKHTYSSIPGPKYFNYTDPSSVFVDASGYYVKPPADSTICIFGENTIYMEIDKFNSIDELDPFPDPNCNYNDVSFCCINKKSNNPRLLPKQNWKSIPKNIKTKDSGRVNSAFAKIPVACIPYSQCFDSRNAYIQNVSQYEPPIERIQKLKFKFRTHDGKLVNFNCMPLNFTLEFNCLKDEIPRSYNVRVPPLYNL